MYGQFTRCSNAPNLTCSFHIPSVAPAEAVLAERNETAFCGGGACRLPAKENQTPGPGNENIATHMCEVRTRLLRQDGFKLAILPLLPQLRRENPIKIKVKPVCPHTLLFLRPTQTHPLWEQLRYQSRSHKGWRQVKSHT